MKGIVKWFNKEKRFGFLTPINEPDEKDIFVHSNDIKDEPKILLDGQNVEFDIDFGIRGKKAKNVVVVPTKEISDDQD